MRILLINYEYPPVGAGSATAAQAIARSLVESGHGAVILTTQFEGLAGIRDEDRVRVIRVASRRRRREAASILEMVSFLVRAGAAVRRTIRDERIDGVIAFFSVPGGPIAWWGHRGTGVPYLVAIRGGDVPGAEPSLRLIHLALQPFRRRILRTARAVVANSAGLKAMSEQADPVAVHVISNGVDTSFFSPSAVPRLADTPFRMLFVGRFQSQKNLQWMLEQLSEVRRLSRRSFTLDLAGDGPLGPELAATVRILRMDDMVRFLGWQNRADLRILYQSADLVLNPSLYEGMPNVVLEAMACGRPVLASRVPGNDAVVADGVTGWLYEPADPAGFRDRVLAALEHPDICVPLGLAARRRVEREFSWERATQCYLELLVGSSSMLPIA